MANFFHLGFVDPNVFFRRLIWMFSVGISGSNRWRYLPYIRPMFEAYVREYPNKIWPYMVQYLHFRILEFPLMFPKMVFFCFHCKPSSYWDTPIYGKSPHLKVGAWTSSWLVVSNMFYFSISYMGCHPSHWRTPSIFKMVKSPPTRFYLDGVPVVFFYQSDGGDFPWIVWRFCRSGLINGNVRIQQMEIPTIYKAHIRAM